MIAASRSFGKTYREVGASVSQLAEAEDCADDEDCPVGEDASGTDSGVGGVPMGRCCCILPGSRNHKD